MTKTMLPEHPKYSIIMGNELFGDNFSEKELKEWFDIEAEGFSALESNAKASKEDPWYAYNRYINEKYVWDVIDREFGSIQCISLLVLGPGSGEELETYIHAHSNVRLRLIEPSAYFRRILAEKFPKAIIESGLSNGVSVLDKLEHDAIVALQVFHHVANVSKTIHDLSIQLKKGGLLISREPCSSMGLWAERGKYLDRATPNERGIPKQIMIKAALREGLQLYSSAYPLPICLDPLNKLILKMHLYPVINNKIIYLLDRVLGGCLKFNDYYWRDRWWKKLGPSTYHYIFKRSSLDEGV